MDEATYNQVIAALSIIQDSKSENSSRQECTAWLEEFITRSDCVEYLYYILTTQHPAHTPTAQFLCLKLIEDWVINRWNSIGIDERVRIRVSVLELLDNIPIYDNSSPVRTRLAKIIVEIAEREYPQQWPSFLDDIVSQHWSQDHVSKSKVCMMVFEFLAEDCVDPDFNSSLPSKRRDEIITGLQGGMHDLLVFAFTWLCKVVQAPPSGGGQNTVETLIAPALQMLSKLVLIAKPDLLCEEPHDFTQIAVHLLSPVPSVCADEIQQAAAAFLHKLCHMKTSPELFWSLLRSIPPAVSRLPTLDHDTMSAPETMQVYRCMGEAFSNLLSGHVDTIVEVFKAVQEFNRMRKKHISGAMRQKHQDDEQHMNEVSEYIKMLADFSAHPSRRLAAVMSKDWLRVLKEPEMARADWFQPLCTHILSINFPKSMKAQWGDGTDTCSGEALDDFVAAEFMDYDEYIEFHGQFRWYFNALCQAVSTASPHTAATLFRQKAEELIGGDVSQMPCTFSEEEKRMMTTYVLKWEAFVSFVENILVGMSTACFPGQKPDPNQPDLGDIFPSLVTTADMVLNWCPSDGSLLLNCVRAIQNLNPILKHSTDLLGRAYGRLFDSMNFSGLSYGDTAPASRAGGVETENLTDIALQVRRRAGSAISVISFECSDIIISSGMLGTLCTTVQSMMQTGRLIPSQYSSMLEALVSVSEKIPDMAERQQLLYDILGDTISSLQSDTVNSIFSSSKNLLDACPDFVSQRAESLFGKAVSALSTVINISRRSPYVTLPNEVWVRGDCYSLDDLSRLTPFCAVWTAILPTVITAIHSLHNMWSPKFRTDLCALSEEGRDVFREPESELLGLIGTKAGLDTSFKQGPHPVTWRSVLNDLRLQLYQLIGQACIHKVFYATPYEFLGMFNNSIEDLMTGMENRHLSMLFKYVLEPMVLNCPPACGPQVSQMLAQALKGGTERLGFIWSPNDADPASRWSPYSQWNSSMENFCHFVYWQCSLSVERDLCNIPQSGVMLDVVREKISFDISRSISDIIGSCCLCRGFLAIQPGEIQSKAKGSGGNGMASNYESDSGDEKHAQLSIRRAALRRVVFGSPLSSWDNSCISDSPLTESFLSTVLMMVQIPHSVICQKAITACHYILQLALDEGYSNFVPFISKEVYGHALLVVVRQEKWTNDNLLWDIISLLEESYTALVLGVHPTQLHADNGDGGTKFTIRSDYPRQILLSPELGIPQENIQSLEAQILEAKGKKKRRDVFKDFIKWISGKNSGQKSSRKMVLDIPGSLQRSDTGML
mmetsp:Transcript_14022/g.20972  ORF Transcript_14022/g.20972 Transcript_14022/m.20972 type:complete len:1286 (+) Transcript_14022:53-3910(+)